MAPEIDPNKFRVFRETLARAELLKARLALTIS